MEQKTLNEILMLEDGERLIIDCVNARKNKEQKTVVRNINEPLKGE
jgi:hypothetical protein